MIPPEVQTALAAAIDEVIADHWDHIRPDRDLDIDEDEVPEPYPAGWTFVLEVASLVNPGTASIVTLTSGGQRPTTTTGQLTYALDYFT